MPFMQAFTTQQSNYNDYRNLVITRAVAKNRGADLVINEALNFILTIKKPHLYRKYFKIDFKNSLRRVKALISCSARSSNLTCYGPGYYQHNYFLKTRYTRGKYNASLACGKNAKVLGKHYKAIQVGLFKNLAFKCRISNL